ncbi:MAG TPA: ribose-phosphate pyrophosphokinase, partial [Cryomorphaceae bacterium]|nr:ribose-phosphate pyrophosphokinase [Cryomorphaceae bacterium]
MLPEAKIFAGRHTMELAVKIAASYNISMGNVIITDFSDGEFVPSFEETVRGNRVFLIQSTNPPADNL